jgi:heptosyltransferase-2
VRVLIIKTGALGDVIRTTSIVPAILAKHPDAKITWVTNPTVASLLRDVRPVSVASDWRHGEYDWVISLEDDPTLVEHIKCDHISGASLQTDGQMYSHEMEEWFGMGLLRPEKEGGIVVANALKRANRATYGEILYRTLGLPGKPVRPYIRLEPIDFLRADELLKGANPIGFATSAGARWKYKRLTEEQTAEIAMQMPTDVLLLGGEAESSRNHRINDLTAGKVHLAPTDFCLAEFAALISRCRLLLTSDSLALHLAVAVGTPVVAFFGPTSSYEIDLFGLGEKIVTPLPCRCCYLKDCDVVPDCMKSIPTNVFVDAIKRQLTIQRDAYYQVS